MISANDRRYRQLECAKWQPLSIDGQVLAGVEWSTLAGTASWVCYWMRMAPGSRSPSHQHTGLELVVVLEGEVQDSDGICFSEGASLVYGAGSQHWLTSLSGCVLLVIETGPATLASSVGAVGNHSPVTAATRESD